MAANAKPALSTITSPAEAVPEYPPAKVQEQANGMVLVKWGEGGAKQTFASAGTDYPSVFSVVDSNGLEPLVKTYGTLLGCDGGTLTIQGTTYRIQRIPKRQQANEDPGDALRQQSGKKRVVYFEDLSDSRKRVKFCECISKGMVRPGTVEEEAEETEKIEFSNDLFGDDKAGKVLYVRDCYKGLFAEIEKERFDKEVGGAVITGTPGIGKTMFSAYLIRQYMDMKVNTILFKFRNEGYILISRSKKWECDGYSYELSATLPEGQEYYVGGLALDHQLPKYLKNLKDVIYIVDLNQEKFQESLPTVFTIILTSSNKEKYASAVSSGTRTVAVLWMPVWSLEELQQHNVPIENLEARYQVHGGILRYLLWREADAKRDLKAVLDSSDSNEFTLALDKDCKDANISGRLVHYQLQNLKDYRSSKAVFASKQIRDRVANRFYLRERLSFQATIDKMKFDSSFGSPRGILSELVWHHQLRSGGAFKMKKLKAASDASGVEDLEVRALDGEVTTCEHDMRDLKSFQEDEYVSPFGNLPALDAFMVTKKPLFDYENTSKDTFLVGFQMAGSKNREHSLKGPQVIKWIDVVKKVHPCVSKIAIVFVVNPEDLAGWNKQDFKTKHNKDGKWRSYKVVPSQLKEVQQIGLGMPQEGREGGD